MAGLERPLLVYDGDCGFCMRWAQRWRRATAGRVDYVSNHAVAERFPAAEPGRVPAADYRASVVLFEPDGGVHRGAQAVFRSLSSRWWGALLLGAYRFVPGVRPLTEWGYGVVARNRQPASKLDALLVGRDVVLSTWDRSRRVFLGALALVALVAFVSLGVQVHGLVGSQGIVPAAEWLDAVAGTVGDGAAWRLPTLLWLDAGDGMLSALCWGGALLSLLLLFDRAPALCAALMATAYLSLQHASQRFLHFQWDSLLVEMLVLAVWLAPWRLRRRPAGGVDPPPPALARWLVWILLFRFVFESGVVKLTSGDASWRDLTALSYHYWTQPLPHAFSVFAAGLPPWMHKASAAAMFVVELGLPFLIVTPRRLRHLGALGIIGLQVVIGATGNYGFFNLLTIVLCGALLDDQWWRHWVPWLGPRAQPGPQAAGDEGAGAVAAGDAATGAGATDAGDEGAATTTASPAGTCGLAAPGELPPYTPPPRPPAVKRVLLVVFAVPVLLVGALQVRDLWVEQPWPDEAGLRAGVVASLADGGPWAALRHLDARLRPFNVVNPYGLFRVMTRTRPEIRLQASHAGTAADGRPPDDWVEIDFRWKPGAPHEWPRWCQPHMPRLDWLLWFDALRWEPYARSRRAPFPGTRELGGLMDGILRGRREVLDLLGDDPFPGGPPRQVRAQLWSYRLATSQERADSGDVWVTEPLDLRGLTLTRRD